MAAVAGKKSFTLQVDGLKGVSFPDDKTVSLKFTSLEKAQAFSKTISECANMLILRIREGLLDCSSPDDKVGERIFCLNPYAEKSSRMTSVYEAARMLGCATECSTAAKYVIEYIKPTTKPTTGEAKAS